MDDHAATVRGLGRVVEELNLLGGADRNKAYGAVLHRDPEPGAAYAGDMHPFASMNLGDNAGGVTRCLINRRVVSQLELTVDVTDRLCRGRCARDRCRRQR